MSRQRGIAVENSFIQGLITETTALNFPEKACTETYDCVFTRIGKVTRRPGFQPETSNTPYSVAYAAGQATVEYLWTACGGLGSKSILVVQQADKVLFYDVSDTDSISSHRRSETITLSSYLPSGSSKVPATYPCSFAQGNGDLFISNEALPPLYVSYNSASDSLTTSSITVQFRDFIGVTSENAVLTTRPTDTVASLKSGSPKHYYNLLNQGWAANAADALTQWDAARSDMPSMADIPALYRNSETDTFDNNKVLAKDPMNVPAPKGHFILTAWNHDRNAAMTADGFTGATIGSADTAISYGSGTIISTGIGVGQWSNVAYAFNGVSNTNYGSSSAWGQDDLTYRTHYIGKSFSSGGKQITKAIVYGSNDWGFSHSANNTVILKLYGKQGAAPSGPTDGTELASVSFTDTTNESAGRTLTSSDAVTYWDHAWIYINGQDSLCLTEIVFYTPAQADTETVVTVERPSSVAFFAGRAWYAGINAPGLSNNIYFSQIIERKEQYGRCYQKNDPAGEYYTDLLVDDGGVIKILEMGTVTRLFPTRSALFVFATNGIWQISGTSGAGFKATDYVVRRISNVGTTAKLSFVDFKGLPIWWGDDGIYGLQFDSQSESYTAENIILKSIKTFYTSIPTVNRKYAKGAYDPINDYVYWVYNSLDTPYHYYDYNRVLVMNGATGALFPWTISSSTTIGVRGVRYVVDPTLTHSPKVKFITAHSYSLSTESVGFSEASNTDYTDWPAAEATSYSSYFITGYKIHGDTQRFTQPNYVFVFLEQGESASLYMRSIYDFTNSGDSGKWSTAQQCYNQALLLRNVNFRRLKVRGKGRAMQFKFYSEAGKPFTCLGWSVNESANSDI